MLLLLLLVSHAPAHAESVYNIMVIDSSFVPIKVGDFAVKSDRCFLINENNLPLPETGSCYDEKSWKGLEPVARDILVGYLDALSKRSTDRASQYQAMLKEKRPLVEPIVQRFKLLTHGTRSVYLAWKQVGTSLKPLLVRNTSTQSGATGKQNQEALEGKKGNKYADGCTLENRNSSEMSSYDKGEVQPFQERIAQLLRKHPSIRVINLSFGYKKKWIEEDNPKCSKDEVSKEYEALTKSWINLIKKFPDRVFVVAAGNEGEDFSAEALRTNDLWAAISPLANLVLVGSLDQAGNTAKFSNRGLSSMVMEIGEKLPVEYPVPGFDKTVSTEVQGTSASAPIVSGRIVKLLAEGVPVDGLRSALAQKKRP
jgi:hypothetical protein